MSCVPQGADVLGWLRSESKLPGPRANLEILHKFVSEATVPEIQACLEVAAAKLPPDSPDEFVAMCGIAASGRLVAQGQSQFSDGIRKAASHGSHRVREAAALAIQEIARKSPQDALAFCAAWEKTSHYEKRCVAAGLCDPIVLQSPAVNVAVLEVLEEILIAVDNAKDIKTDDYKSLKKVLGYSLSVAVASQPQEGMEHFEEWMRYDSIEVKSILLENLKQARLVKMNRTWVDQQIEFLAAEDDG